MNQYETGFIVAPNLAEEEATTLINQLVEVIRPETAVDQERPLGKTQAGYPIKRFNEGLYVFLPMRGPQASRPSWKEGSNRLMPSCVSSPSRKTPEIQPRAKKKVKAAEAVETAPAGAEPQAVTTSPEEVK